MKTIYFFLLIPLATAVISATPLEFRNPQAIDFKILKTTHGLTISYDLEKYYKEVDAIGGWFDKRLIIILAMLDKIQTDHTITGNVGEIGVLHGKSFVPLFKLAKKDECGLAIDCFGMSEHNKDASGGNASVMASCYKQFMSTICRYFLYTNNLRIIKGDSYQLTSQNLLEKAGNQKGFRMFSIDGCHEADHTERDMENAYNSLVDGGIIIIDDYFHCCWPGVSEGVNRFMLKHPNALKPFFIGWNKVFFTHPAYIENYQEALKAMIIPYDQTIKKFFGVATLIYDPKG